MFDETHLPTMIKIIELLERFFGTERATQIIETVYLAGVVKGMKDALKLSEGGGEYSNAILKARESKQH